MNSYPGFKELDCYKKSGELRIHISDLAKELTQEIFLLWQGDQLLKQCSIWQLHSMKNILLKKILKMEMTCVNLSNSLMDT